MTSKEVKNLLKVAKECIDKREFATGLQCVKNALQKDKNNYMALVLLGACLQETDQSADTPKAFKKAISLTPDHALAWRGLASFYEKQNKESDRTELLRAYVQLLKIEVDSSKIEEWARKIGVLLSLLDNETLFNTWNELFQFSEEKKAACEKMMFTVIGSMDGDAPHLFLPIMKQILSRDWGENGKQYCVNIYRKYFKLLFKTNQLDIILTKSRDLLDKYSDVTLGPEWYCKAYLEAKFGTDCYGSELPEPSEMYMTLLTKVPDSYLGFACKGVDELDCHSFVAACDSFSHAVQLKPTYAIAWYLLTQSQTWLHRFPEAEFSARQALKHWKLSDKNVQCINNCKYWLAKSLCEQDVQLKWKEAVRIADEFVYDDSNKCDFLPILVKTCIKLDDAINFEKYIGLLSQEATLRTQKLLLEAFWLKKCGNVEQRKSLLNKAIEYESTSYEAWLELGQIYYESGDLKESLKFALNATKQNEWCPANFRLLGHIYKKLGDLTKARRCYQRAFQLSSDDFEAGIGLSDVYRILGMEEENLNFLRVATQVPGARWAWLKMGLHFLSVNNPIEAVNSLRVAVRLNADDRHAWESLGDAYLALGSLNAAFKSYERVLELDSTLVYPVLQIAKVKHLQGLHEEAVLEFRHTLKLQPDFLPALHSHAMSCLALTKERWTNNLNGLAADACQEAVTSLVAALKIKKDVLCVWKLLGDACVLFSKFPEKYCNMAISSWLWSPNETSNEEIVLKRRNILQMAVRSFCQAIALNPNLPELWYDLAIAYHCLADLLSSNEKRQSARESAWMAVKKCLKLNNASWCAWNLLGLLSMTSELKNYPVAQHAFAKAIDVNEWNAVPWCNLGTLYLILEDLELANKCFTEAQRCDPNYVQCWIGQAMLAERTGHHEAMDLFRHSTQLGFHPEGALGFASLVLLKLLTTKDKTDKEFVFSIKNMNAVVTACDVLTWYTDRYPNNPYAENMLGLLLERRGLHVKSSEAFFNALNAISSSSSHNRDSVLLNYGRSLLHINRPEESIVAIKQIRRASFASQCVLAWGYMLGEQPAEAYDTYQNALEVLAPDDEHKSYVLVAMAGVIYVHQGHQDAKLLLMQACGLQPVSIAGLFACCSLGILHSDLPLTELALKELNQFSEDPRYIADISLLQSYTALIKGQHVEARRRLCSVAHRRPDDPQVWLQLGLLQLLLYPEGDAKAAIKCFQRALDLGRSQIDVSKATSLMSLGHLLSGNCQDSMRSAQKAVWLFPTVPENWMGLIAAVLARNVTKASARELLWLKKIVVHVKTRLNLSDGITCWLSKCENIVDLLINSVLGMSSHS